MTSLADKCRRLLRDLLGIVPTLDLHGYGVREALDEAERFLRRAHAFGEPKVRIVYGKGHGSPGGRGVLREVVPRWLERDGAALVVRYRRVPDATGADGAVEVWLRVCR
jgi:DNA-nicking Smr family endonuclease